MSEKVPLHIYEKTQRSKKRVDQIGATLAGIVVLGVAAGVLYYLGLVVVGIWVIGGGGWLMGIGALLGLLIYLIVRSNYNDRILADAEAYGVIDE